MNADLLFEKKELLPDGSIIQMCVWKVSQSVPGSAHFHKYRLFYGRNGIRVVGYDNERGKGDHCHLDGKEYPYLFLSVDQLIDDFLTEVFKRAPP